MNTHLNKRTQNVIPNPLAGEGPMEQFSSNENYKTKPIFRISNRKSMVVRKTKPNRDTATMKKQNEPKVGEASLLRTVLSKQTQFFLCGPLCGSVAKNAKQTQISAFSIKNQRLSKKQSQIKAKKLSAAKSAAGGQTQSSRSLYAS